MPKQICTYVEFFAYLEKRGYNLRTPWLWVAEHGWKEASRMQDEAEGVCLHGIETDPEDSHSYTLAPAAAGE